MPANKVDLKQLLEAGAHFGHKTSRWHPKMAPYIHSKRGGTHIIDLVKTADRLEAALNFLQDTTASGKQVLFVGTKRQAHDIVKRVAEATNQPFVVERWLGGMLTNQKTIGGRVKYLKDQEGKIESGQLAARYSKFELQRYQEEIDQMNFLYGGIKNMAAKPGAVFVVDVLHEMNAIKEARKLNIPVVAIVDTNADPTLAQYPIPANDDAIKTIELILGYIQQAIEAGQSTLAKKAEKETAPADKDEAPAEAAAK
jgi:small subunit ribosomal protein S2